MAFYCYECLTPRIKVGRGYMCKVSQCAIIIMSTVSQLCEDMPELCFPSVTGFTCVRFPQCERKYP